MAVKDKLVPIEPEPEQQPEPEAEPKLSKKEKLDNKFECDKKRYESEKLANDREEEKERRLRIKGELLDPKKREEAWQHINDAESRQGDLQEELDARTEALAKGESQLKDNEEKAHDILKAQGDKLDARNAELDTQERSIKSRHSSITTEKNQTTKIKSEAKAEKERTGNELGEAKFYLKATYTELVAFADNMIFNVKKKDEKRTRELHEEAKRRLALYSTKES